MKIFERWMKPSVEVGELKVKKGDKLMPKFGINKETLRSHTINLLDSVVGTVVRVTECGQSYSDMPDSMYAKVKVVKIVDEEKRVGESVLALGGLELRYKFLQVFLLQKILKW